MINIHLSSGWHVKFCISSKAWRTLYTVVPPVISAEKKHSTWGGTHALTLRGSFIKDKNKLPWWGLQPVTSGGGVAAWISWVLLEKIRERRSSGARKGSRRPLVVGGRQCMLCQLALPFPQPPLRDHTPTGPWPEDRGPHVGKSYKNTIFFFFRRYQCILTQCTNDTFIS